MTTLTIIVFCQLILIAVLIKREIALSQALMEANEAGQGILKDYQDCIGTLKKESERASLYYTKYMNLIGQGSSHGKINPGIGSGGNSPTQ